MTYPIKDSTYQHYKGNFYTIICVAKCSETDEHEKYFVIYQCLSTGTIYSRPLESFCENVNGVPRFKLYWNALRKDTPELKLDDLMKYNDLLERLKRELPH